MPNDYTTLEAAQLLGLSPITVRSLIYRKQLEARRRGRDWFIATEEIEHYRSERRGPGRPLSSMPTPAALTKRKSRNTAT